jgi:hypothetical protein
MTKLARGEIRLPNGYCSDAFSSKGPDWVSSVLRHQEYINTLPHDGLTTPLFFTEEELTLLHGTNLYHATIDRKREWYTGWQRVRQWLHGVFELDEDEFTWYGCYFCPCRVLTRHFRAQFLRAHTWLSSRAFPSSLMADPPSLSSRNSVPVLVPLVDALNHARGTPISWSIDNQEEVVGVPSQVTNKSLSLVSHESTEAFKEMFNNYGAKPNDELLLGYGFTLANNPEDVLHLKLPGSERHFKILRAALGLGEAQVVWDEIGRRLQEAFATDEDDLDIAFAELQLEIGQILPEMLRDLKAKLPLAAFESSLPGIRPEVREMVWNYVDGMLLLLLLIKGLRRLTCTVISRS